MRKSFSAPDAATGTTTANMNSMIEAMLNDCVEARSTLTVIETESQNEKIGYYGVALWSKDCKQLEISTFYLGVDGQSDFAKAWDKAVCRLPYMFIDRWGYIPCVKATSTEDVENQWYEAVYNKAA